MRAAYLVILAAATGCISIFALLADAASQGTARATSDAAASRIVLIDALAAEDNDASHAVAEIARNHDLARETGLALVLSKALDPDATSGSSVEIAARTKAALLKGEIEGALLPLSAFLRQSALFGADQIPFLVVDGTANARLIAALNPLIDDLLAEHGLALLGLLPMRPVGLMGDALRPSGLPKTIAVSGAAGRRLAELIGAEAVDEVPAPLTKQAVEMPLAAAYARIPEPHGNPTAAAEPILPPDTRQRRSAPSDERSLLALASWPIAMIVVRRAQLVDMPNAVHKQFWPEAARHSAVTHERWQRAISLAQWPSAATGLMAAAIAPPHGGPTNETAGVAKPDRDPHDLTHGEIAARLRAAGLAMAEEWAQGAGADGFSLLLRLGVQLRIDR